MPCIPIRLPAIRKEPFRPGDVRLKRLHQLCYRGRPNSFRDGASRAAPTFVGIRDGEGFSERQQQLWGLSWIRLGHADGRVERLGADMLQEPWIAAQPAERRGQTLGGRANFPLPPGENPAEGFRFGRQMMTKLSYQRFSLAAAGFGIEVGNDGQFGQAGRPVRQRFPDEQHSPRVLCQVPFQDRVVGPLVPWDIICGGLLGAADRRVPSPVKRHRFPIDGAAIHRRLVVAELDRLTVQGRGGIPVGASQRSREAVLDFVMVIGV